MRLAVIIIALFMCSCGSYNGWGNWERMHGMLIGTTKKK